MNNIPKPIENLSVRLSKEGIALGSGFLVVQPSDAEFVYVLTALHCLAGRNGESISVDRFNYSTGLMECYPIESQDLKILSFEDAGSELCLVRFPKERLSFEIPPVKLRLHPTEGSRYRFRGFPDAHKNTKPEEIGVEIVLDLGSSFTGKTNDALEDNLTIASANMKGFSGSGLYQVIDDQIELCGIITHIGQLNRFIICPFREVNKLLELEKLPVWETLTANQKLSPKAQDIGNGPYYQLSSKFFESAEALIEELKPGQAQRILETALPQLQKDPMNEMERNALLARLFFLEGLTKADLGIKNESYESIIHAYRLFPSNLEYQERAAISLLKLGERQEALELSEQIIGINRLNPRAWVVLSQIYPETDVPQSVRNEPIFKTLTISFWQTEDLLVPIRDFALLFQEDADKRLLPPIKIPRSELYYWFYLAQFVFFDFLTSNLKIHFVKKSEHLANADELRYASQIYEEILRRVDQTELKDTSIFRLCQFDYLLCMYFLTGEEKYVNGAYQIYTSKSFEALPFKQLTPLRESVPNRAFDMLICLMQTGQPTKALKVLETYPQPFEPYVYLLKAHALDLEGNYEDAVRLYKDYLSGTTHVSELEFGNFCEVINILKAQNEPIDTLITISVTDKAFLHKYYQPLLTALIQFDSPGRDKAIGHCEAVYNGYRNELSKGMKGILAFMFFNLGLNAQTLELLSGEIDLSRESDDLKIYILALSKSGNDFKEVLRLLGDWRKNFTPDERLTLMEVNLYYELMDHVSIEEVARYGIQQFPDKPVYTVRLIDALNWQERHEELAPYLNATILTKLDLDWRIFFQLGNVCFANTKYEEGLELYYHGLKKEPDNPRVRESYFMNLNTYIRIDEIPYPENAEQDMVVKLTVDGKDSVVELTATNIAYNPLAKALLGRKSGERFTIRNQSLGRNIEYVVSKVIDRARGQFDLFADRIAKNPQEAVHVWAIPFDSENPEGLLKKVDKDFEKQRIEKRVFDKLYLEKYRNREIGFTQLFRSVFRDNPLSAWQYVTSRNSDGFPVVPIIHQQIWQFETEVEFVLDFSTLFTLFHISDGQDLTVSGRPFIISQVLKCYIQSEAIECEIRRKEYLRADTNNYRIDSYFLSEKEAEEQVSFYKNLMVWINKHCRTDFDPTILSIKRQLDVDIANLSLHHHCLLDTAQLAHSSYRFLVSDDLLHYNDHSDIRVMTLEYFLANYYSTAYADEYSFKLIGLNYRGLTLKSYHLSQCFGKNQLLGDSQSDFFLALNSFSVQHNPLGLNISRILEFVRDIYAGDLGLPFKRQVSSTVLHHFLADILITNDVLQAIEININELFGLMQNHLVHVKQDVIWILTTLKSRSNQDIG